MSIFRELADRLPFRVTFSTTPTVDQSDPAMARWSTDSPLAKTVTGHDEAIAGLTKQMADLRSIVSRIGKETKEAPRHARSAADVRQFVQSTEGEE